MSIFSERLRELREQSGLSMLNLARKIGVSDAAVCKWENEENEPKASYILLLSNFFEVSTDYLLGLENDLGTKKYTSPVSPTLSQDEQSLLDDYRSLAPALQEMLRATIQTWKGSDANVNAARSKRRKA